MPGKVFVNRTLNLKKIRYIGVDMDHTLVRYNSENFERLSHTTMINKLVKRGYPETLRKLTFDYNFAIRGLVIDRKMGNLLKLNRYTAIRASYHGLKPLDFKSHQKLYKSTYIDLSNTDYLAVDTSFSISLANLIAQIVELKDTDVGNKYPEYSQIADDVLDALDEAHRDGSLKDEVKKNLEHFIIKDPELVAGLEKFRRHGKKIFVLTNSDFHYTKLLLDYAVQPFLKEHQSWQDLFEIVITFASKPKFFYESQKYLRVNPADGTMTNMEGKLTPGIYQGGNAKKFTADLELAGDDILYIGDHIYGDILRLKKDCNWRTAMVIEELSVEVDNNKAAEPLNQEIEILMRKKEPLEDELTDYMTRKIEKVGTVSEQQVETLQKSISEIDSQISQLIKKQQLMYNSNWGQLMRAGNEESYFAYQLDRYACVYMEKLADLLELSPRTYFRAPRRPLAHEIY
ncbi:HAD-IG family 5'-nucleotidase [Bdellovibrio reynosensis]|uniref:HAD-IG family 5'-nucleotidase n=1 Tax=Bdellovibrio reynosensis TaxID=2835041 RepID=A0ABY4C6X9_9BACT|nr:HAD-IG family 5'-nucleotidase [Bdellovibrio reynosensis]UOF00728.1 HAD-IG family 5'-nucleotidase [Bdellovibrio reynosensis]